MVCRITIHLSHSIIHIQLSHWLVLQLYSIHMHRNPVFLFPVYSSNWFTPFIFIQFIYPTLHLGAVPTPFIIWSYMHSFTPFILFLYPVLRFIQFIVQYFPILGSQNQNCDFFVHAARTTRGDDGGIDGVVELTRSRCLLPSMRPMFGCVVVFISCGIRGLLVLCKISDFFRMFLCGYYWWFPFSSLVWPLLLVTQSCYFFFFTATPVEYV